MLYESRSVRRMKQRKNETRQTLIWGGVALIVLLAAVLWFWPPTAIAQTLSNLLGARPNLTVDAMAPPPNESKAESGVFVSSVASIAASEATPVVAVDKPTPVTVDEVVVPISAAVGDDYFSDALFIGDSISHGLDHYRIIPNASFICSTGINLGSLWTRTDDFVAPYKISDTIPEGAPITMMQMIAAQPAPGKIYVMMGTNGIAWLGLSTMLSDYDALLEQLRQWFPEALIYVQGIPPATVAAGLEYPGFTPISIRNYNEGLKKLAVEKGARYLDVFTALGDAAGYLPEEVATAGDGVHFSPTHYQVWYDFLKTHTYRG